MSVIARVALTAAAGDHHVGVPFAVVGGRDAEYVHQLVVLEAVVVNVALQVRDVNIQSVVLVSKLCVERRAVLFLLQKRTCRYSLPYSPWAWEFGRSKLFYSF